MPDQLTRLRTTFMSLPRRAQVSVMAVAVVALLIMLMLVRSATTTSWVLVPTDSLKGTQASDAQTALTARKITNRLTNAQMIEVPQASLADATATLAAANIGGVGTHTTCQDAAKGSSSIIAAGSEQTKNARTSCMQNEIANVVEHFPGVASAQVNLKTPTEQLFTNDQKPSGAGIFVKMESSSDRLDAAQVKAIRSYVSNAVENVKPGDVLVTDEQGVLSAGGSGGGAGMSEASLKRNMERLQNQQVESDLTAKFDQIAGPGQVNVISNVELDMDKVRREVKDYGGPDNQQGPVSAEKTGAEIVGGTPLANGGPAGSTSNVGNSSAATGSTVTTSNNSLAAVAPGSTVVAPGAGGTGVTTGTAGGSNYDHSTVDRTYTTDEVVQAIDQAQGAVKKNRLAIIVDERTPLATQNAIKSAAQAYMGGNAGDSFSFSVAPFHHPAGSGNAAAGRRAAIGMYFKWLVAGLGLLGMAFLLRRQLNQRTEELLYPIDEPFLLEQGGFEPIPLAELEAAVSAATSLESQKRIDLQRRIEAIAIEKPQDVATAVRGWLHDDADGRGYDYSASTRH